MTLSTKDVPSETDIHPIVGEKTTHTLDDLRRRRNQEVVFALAKRLLERYYADQPWLFPQLARLAREWLAGYVTLKDNTFVQMLLLRGPLKLRGGALDDGIALERSEGIGALEAVTYVATALSISRLA